MAHLDIAPDAPASGEAHVPTDAALRALLRRAADRARELLVALPEDLSADQRVGVANGAARIVDAVAQTTAAMGLARRPEARRGAPVAAPEAPLFVGYNRSVDDGER